VKRFIEKQKESCIAYCQQKLIDDEEGTIDVFEEQVSDAYLLIKAASTTKAFIKAPENSSSFISAGGYSQQS